MEFIKSSSNGTEEEQLEFYEQIFNALADKIRLKILHSIRQSNTKSLCVCDLEELLELKQSKLSYHLKKDTYSILQQVSSFNTTCICCSLIL